MTRLLVIADDLTGAADTGAKFASQGVSTLLLIEPEGVWPNGAAESQVVVVNTESRHLAAKEAARKVTSVARCGVDFGATHFYKKTDSTLRGNVGAEIEALRVATRRRVLAFLPAYPRLGRITANGIQYVDGTPLAQTAFAEDPLEPASESSISTIIGRQTTTPCLVVTGSDTVILEDDSIETILVFDAGTDEDLREVGEMLKRKNLLEVTAGSAGFAEYLPELLGLETTSAQVLPRLRSPMLVAGGSLNPASLAQLAHAELNGFASVIVPPEALVVEDGPHSADGRAVIEKALRLARSGRDVIIRSVGQSGDTVPYRQGTRSATHQLIAKNFGELVAEVGRCWDFGSLTVFGGDTLLAIARSHGWSALVPCGEILPGVVVSEVMEQLGGAVVVTKAGGFGPVDVLSQLKRVSGSKAE